MADDVMRTRASSGSISFGRRTILTDIERVVPSHWTAGMKPVFDG